MKKATSPDEREFREDAALKAQPDFVTGYQYSPDNGRFIGPYTIHNNKDKMDVHLPPFTTLEKPPAVSAGQEAFWRDGSWVVDASTKIRIYQPDEPPEPHKVEVPVFKKVNRPKPEKPDETEELIEIEREVVTIESIQQNATTVREKFEAQQRAWGLMK